MCKPYKSLNFIAMVLKKIQVFTAVFLNDKKSKAGRKPKLTDEEVASIFILSFITGMPAMKIANQILNPSIRSYRDRFINCVNSLTKH
ncbi:MAG: hypothetical protein ACP5UF_07010 [Hydrogenobaculum sp.]